MNWREYSLRYWELVNKNELMALGGQVTYYIILSFFPLLIFFLTLIGYININSEQFFENFKYLLPEEAYLIVESIIYEIFSKRSPTLLSLGMLGTIWASLNGISALMRGIVKAYNLTEKRTFIRLELTSIVFLFIITITIILSIMILFLGENLSNALFETLGVISLFPYLWLKLRLFIQFLLLTITFIILNRMATNANYTTKMVFPGSIFTAAGWVILSITFSYYVRHFSNFSIAYGSIGGLMILLLWIYWCTEILLLGCALNALLIESKKRDMRTQ